MQQANAVLPVERLRFANQSRAILRVPLLERRQLTLNQHEAALLVASPSRHLQRQWQQSEPHGERYDEHAAAETSAADVRGCEDACTNQVKPDIPHRFTHA
jgi:hypothetical protein